MLSSKKCFVILIIMVLCIAMVSGCRAMKGACDDLAGTASWISEKLEPIVDKKDKADADREAKWLVVWTAQQQAKNDVLGVVEEE